MIRLVLASSHLQYQLWRREEGLVRDDRSARRVRDFQDLRGLGDRLTAVVLPGFWDLPRADQLWTETQEAVARSQVYPDRDAPP